MDFGASYLLRHRAASQSSFKHVGLGKKSRPSTSKFSPLGTKADNRSSSCSHWNAWGKGKVVFLSATETPSALPTETDGGEALCWAHVHSKSPEQVRRADGGGKSSSASAVWRGTGAVRIQDGEQQRGGVLLCTSLSSRLEPGCWVLQKHGANDVHLHSWQHPKAPAERKLKRAHKML